MAFINEKLDDKYSLLLFKDLRIHNMDENPMILNAMKFAKYFHHGQKRKSNEPYYMHPVAVARIALYVKQEEKVVSAALLHDVVEDTRATLTDVEEVFGSRVAQIVYRLTRVRDGQKISIAEITNESCFVKDKDAILIKICDRMHNLETIQFIENAEKRADIIERIDIPENIKEIAVQESSIWAPDNKKFLYNVQNGENLEYWVYNMEKPIPVGEKKENLVFTTKTEETQPNVTWYADSFHLILTEGAIEESQRGTIRLIRIDGTNKTEIYNNTLFSDNVFSAPGGDKVIMLSSFKSNEQTDLYTVGIR